MRKTPNVKHAKSVNSVPLAKKATSALHQAVRRARHAKKATNAPRALHKVVRRVRRAKKVTNVRPVTAKNVMNAKNVPNAIQMTSIASSLRAIMNLQPPNRL